VIILLASVIFAVGVRVDVQVTPPSPVLKFVRTPLLTVKSAVVNPVTASEKVKVTRDVSPIIKEVSVTVIVAVGEMVSTVQV
jgi:hypothetical protein